MQEGVLIHRLLSLLFKELMQEGVLIIQGMDTRLLSKELMQEGVPIINRLLSLLFKESKRMQEGVPNRLLSLELLGLGCPCYSYTLYSSLTLTECPDIRNNSG